MTRLSEREEEISDDDENEDEDALYATIDDKIMNKFQFAVEKIDEEEDDEADEGDQENDIESCSNSSRSD